MRLSIAMPGWLGKELAERPHRFPDPTDRMRLAIEMARMNWERETGGPFAAGVFERDSGRLVSLGVNRVVPMACSSAHAEIMALSLAQNSLQSWDLGEAGLPAYQLVVNWRTCAMCFGAVIWSGVRSLVIAGSDDEMERITGFDEGPMLPEWKSELAARGIEVVDNLLREEALEGFRAFADSGALVYNARRAGG